MVGRRDELEPLMDRITNFHELRTYLDATKEALGYPIQESESVEAAHRRAGAYGFLVTLLGRIPKVTQADSATGGTVETPPGFLDH